MACRPPPPSSTTLSNAVFFPGYGTKVRLQPWRYPIASPPLLRWRAVYRDVTAGFYNAKDQYFQEAFDNSVPVIVCALLAVISAGYCCTGVVSAVVRRCRRGRQRKEKRF